VIPDLPPLYVEHLVAPRHARDLKDAHAAGEMGSMVGGMGVRVTVSFREGPDGTPVVDAAAARVLGSAAPLAPASWLMERVRGLAPETALAIRACDVLAGLVGEGPGVLPPAVSKGAEFVVAAMQAALGAPGLRPADLRGPGLLVCRCLGVGDRTIRQAIRDGATTPEEVGERCRASHGCRSCRPDLLALIHEERRAARAVPAPDRHPVERIALARAGPLLAASGVPLRDAAVTNGAVSLSLGPPEPDASLSPRGAQEVARHVLRDTVCERIQVALTTAP
jgi:bacterioferritin-associated ferredoxin